MIAPVIPPRRYTPVSFWLENVFWKIEPNQYNQSMLNSKCRKPNWVNI